MNVILFYKPSYDADKTLDVTQVLHYPSPLEQTYLLYSVTSVLMYDIDQLIQEPVSLRVDIRILPLNR